MSYIVFSDTLDRLTIHSRSGAQLESFPANNNVVRGKEGWPSGSYSFGYWVPHAGDDAGSRYGSHGNFVFDVPGRSGMGVHSGRADARNRPGPNHPTYGCIRTTDHGTARLKEIHERDRLTHIVVHG